MKHKAPIANNPTKNMKITLKLIYKFNACYDPKEVGFTDDLELTPLEFIDQFENKVRCKSDIIWLLCRKQFMSDKDIRLFAVWCAREALKLIPSPDPRTVECCNVAERFANGEATKCELVDARATAIAVDASIAAATDTAATDAAIAVYTSIAVYTDAYTAADAYTDAYTYTDAAAAARSAQIEKLKTYFNK